MKFKKLFRSFSYAWRGIRVVFREEQNFRIQLAAAACVAILAIALRASLTQAAILTLVSAAVLVLELLNSVLERIVDAMKPRLHPYVAEVKDIAAAAVLVAACAAVLVAGIIFVPLILQR